MRPLQLLGVLAFAIGVILLAFAWHASNAPVDRLSNALTGRFTNQTMAYVFAGAAAAIGGALLILFGRKG
jgi:drug/metabolite transporter (DMT)-like permease